MFAPFVAAVADYAPAAPLDHPYWSDAAPCSMHIEEVEAIWAPIAAADDWSLLDAKVAGDPADGRRACSTLDRSPKTMLVKSREDGRL